MLIQIPSVFIPPTHTHTHKMTKAFHESKEPRSHRNHRQRFGALQQFVRRGRKRESDLLNRLQTGSRGHSNVATDFSSSKITAPANLEPWVSTSRWRMSCWQRASTASKPPWSASTSWTRTCLQAVKSGDTLMFPFTVPPAVILDHLFNCCRRKELRSLIPPLEPLYTVQQSTKAILAEQQMICIPRLMYVPFLARTWVQTRVRWGRRHPPLHISMFPRLLPWEAKVATYRFMGGDKCMLLFIKNAELKTSSVHVNSS